MKTLLLAVFAALALLLPSCSSTPPAPADEIALTPFEGTILLTTGDLAGMALDTGDGKLHFEHAPPSLAKVEPGSVIVASVSTSTPRGLLRVVRTVTRTMGSLDLDTLNAPLQIAFEKVHIKIQPRAANLGSLGGHPNDLAPLDMVTGPSASASATIPLDIVLFDGDGNPATTDDRVELIGSIGGTVTVGFTLDFDWGLAESSLPDEVEMCILSLLLGPEVCLDSLLPEAKASFGADAQLDAKIKLVGAAIADFSKPFDVLDVTLPPITVIPVPIVPVVTITADVDGGASAGFSAGVHGSVDFTTGVSLDSKHLDAPAYEPPHVSNFDFGPDGPDVTLEAHLKASLGAKVAVLVASVTGPYAEVDAYGELKANLTEDPCWTLHAGLESSLGLTVAPSLPILGTITLFDWHAQPFSFDVPIAHGDCHVPAGASSLPPGGGPSAKEYAMPTFTPWSRLVSSPADGSLAASPTDDAIGWTDLTRSIDGRYFVSGSQITAPLKLDATAESVTWSDRYHEGGAGGPVLTTLRAVQALDSSLMLLTRGTDVTSFGLLDVGQAGGVASYETVAWNDPGCAPTARDLVADGSGGYWASGACSDDKRSFILHLAQDGSVIFAYTLADPGGATLDASALVAVDVDAVIAGRDSPTSGNDAMFAVRFDPTGKTLFAKTYVGCADAPDVSPTSGTADTDGEVTLTGSSSAHHVGFVGRFLKDGRVGFASFPGLSLGVGTVFVANAIAELPTTGFVVGGSTVDVTGSRVTSTPATALVGLDAIGHTLWSKRYTLLDGGVPVASGFPGIRLSDDGGVVAAAIAEAKGGGVGGRVWALEAVAKDGTLPGLDASRARIDDLGIKDVACSLGAADFSPRIRAAATRVKSGAVTAEHASLTAAHVAH